MASQPKSADVPTKPPPQPLAGRSVIVAVGGGISAYKTADVVSKLAQLGCAVTVIMTKSAQRFVTPLTFQSLSGRPVHTDLFDLPDPADPQHIGLTEQAELMLIAPATADLIGKIAGGICDDLVTLMVCAAACPVVLAPAMNDRMWANPIVRANCARLSELGYRFIGPESGWLACRNVGPGRMSEPQAIVETIQSILATKPKT